ncbi:MAG: terminase family protein, partial [Ignavibacteria bacterium]|nr:terminase family protein [Ignavibacteria bacterium]
IGWSPYKPKRHEKQIGVMEYGGDEIVICAGRQAGKTYLSAYFALKALLEEKKQVALIAPSYNLTGRVMNYLMPWAQLYFRNEMKVWTRPPQKIMTKWGSQLDCWSATEPEQILGKGYDLIIVDECARISETVWHTYIVPASGVKKGKYIYISTPRGRNWFWRLWRKVSEKGGAFQWGSWENPYFDKAKIEQEKKRLPELVFRQEYGSEFLENVMVFQGLDNCISDYPFPQEYNENHLYVMGVDLGRYEDFTAVCVMDLMTNSLVAFHRFQGDWVLQKEKIVSISDKYGQCPIWIDATSITAGDAYVDELSNAGYHVTGYKIHNNIPKRQLVEKAIVLIQNKEIALPEKGADELITELRAYSYDITPGGVIRYQAPQGEHDDGVMALCFACLDIEEKPMPEMKKGQIEDLHVPEQTF